MTYSPSKSLAGQRFGRLTVVELASTGGAGKHSTWLCQCDCGNTSVVTRTALRSGGTKSCGCLQKELASERTTTHGMTGTSVFVTWQQMKRRCYSPNSISYPNYGARGISVCQEWRDSFESFLACVSALPGFGSIGVTMDRIDNDGDYEPNNVQWATLQQQHRNTRRNVMIVHNGKTQCLAAWADELGVPSSTLYTRLGRGWDVERAFTTPVRPRVKP